MQGVDGPKTANTGLILADILQAQGRYKDANKLADVALDIYVRGGVDSALHAEAYQRVAVAQASQGRWADAMATYEKLRSAVAKDNSARRRHIDTNLDLAVALLRAGQAQQAIPILEGVVKNRTGSGAGEYAVAEAFGFLGAALAAVGRDGDAARNLRSVIPILLTTDNRAAKEEGQVDEAQRRQVIVDAYFVLLTRIRGTEVEKSLGIDATDEAFRIADVARAKSVHSAIAASSARAASGDTALNELIRQTQDSDQQLAAMSDMLKLYSERAGRSARSKSAADVAWRHRQTATGSQDLARRDRAEISAIRSAYQPKACGDRRGAHQADGRRHAGCHLFHRRQRLRMGGSETGRRGIRRHAGVGISGRRPRRSTAQGCQLGRYLD